MAPLVEALLRDLETGFDERLQRVGRTLDQGLGVVLGRERRENEVSDIARVASPGSTNADAKPEEVRAAQAIGDRTQTVVTREATSETNLEPSVFEVYFVVNDENGFERGLVVRDRWLYRASRVVHVRIGLQEGDSRLADADLADLSAELPLERCTRSAGELVHDHETDVVSIARMLASGVPESDDEQVERRGRPAATEERQELLRVDCGFCLGGRLR